MVNFKDFVQASDTLPAWYNEEIHAQVIVMLIKGNRLQACKYLVELSKENKTNQWTDGEGSKYGLQWAKNEVVDKIERLKKLSEQEIKLYDENLKDYVNSHRYMPLPDLKEKMLIPKWYTESMHNLVLAALEKGNKLVAVKTLKDNSNEDLRTCKDLIWEISAAYKNFRDEFEAYNNNLLIYINKPDLAKKVAAQVYNNLPLLEELVSHVPYPILQMFLDKK